VVLRVVAAFTVSAETVDLHEFGTIAHNLVSGDGYSFLAVNSQGQLNGDPPRGDGTGLTGHRLPSAFVPPAYTALVAVAVVSTDDHAGVVHVMQAINILAAAAMAFLVFLLGRELGGSRAGSAAAWVFALYPPMIYAATQVSSVNVYLPAGMLALVFLLRAARQQSYVWPLAAGAALGVLCLLRSEAVVLIALSGIWLALVRRRNGLVAWVACLVVVASAAALPAAWILRNSLAFERPVLTIATSGGLNLWIGNHEGATGSQKSFTVPAETSTLIAAVPKGDTYEVDVDRVYLQEAVRSIADDPVGTALLDVKKLGMVLTADFYDPRSLNVVYLTSWPLLALLAVAGMRAARPKGGLAWLLYGTLAFNIVIPVVFFVLARHRLSIESILIIFAGAGLARLMDPREPQLPPARPEPAGRVL
jgi:4-amino-4-deoxy-L-arabinose transferase-like glycosyltransferase